MAHRHTLASDKITKRPPKRQPRCPSQRPPERPSPLPPFHRSARHGGRLGGRLGAYPGGRSGGLSVFWSECKVCPCVNVPPLFNHLKESLSVLFLSDSHSANEEVCVCVQWDSHRIETVSRSEERTRVNRPSPSQSIIEENLFVNQCCQ